MSKTRTRRPSERGRTHKRTARLLTERERRKWREAFDELFGPSKKETKQ